ncbi:ABC transporter ATP-binding protein [Halomonas stenophila]|uniref:Peptide/nickel transport system ATP-binding protein n=1 Tax=Halomonas stenophila TaxID=795312 RepID=A0A7W5HLC1_9GAMM|nr:ATP-binding cassette domain-containing protein [Halomonas stenophila]MBB3231357.1 peptide/nickel transport system ATP-binding protein [Halomonas stenophila]
MTLHAIDLGVRAGDDCLVAPCSFRLAAGENLTLLGETGAGKSLLAQAIMGTLPAGLEAHGEVRFDDRELLGLPPGERRKLWGRELVLLPQEPWHALDPLMRAGEQVRETYRFVAGDDANPARERTRRALARLGLDRAARRLPGELSGGMAQRLAFAAATAAGGRLVIADEPTKGLDADRRDEVVSLLQEAQRDGGMLLTITHDIRVARRLGGRVMILRDGRCVEEGDAAEVLRRPRSDFGRRLLAADPAEWPARDTPPRALGEPVLRAHGLGKTLGGRALFEGLSLALSPGEVVGITGPSGCGKSTLGNLLLGLGQPDRGHVERAAGIAPHRFQKLYQDPPAAFAPHWTLGTLLDDLLRRHRLAYDRVPPLLERLRLSPALLSRRPGEVSGGELQRLSLLRVLLLDPVLLFADEPTSRLDPLTQREILPLMTDLARERDCALLLVSHDRELIHHSCDRTIALAGDTSMPQPGLAAVATAE